MAHRLYWLVAMIGLLAAGCGGGDSRSTPVPLPMPAPVPAVGTVGSIELYQPPPLRPRWSTLLGADVFDQTGKYLPDFEDIAWSSSNPAVASISGSTVLRANAIGKTTITAKAGDVMASMVFEVTADAVRQVQSVSAGGRHTCATTFAGPPICWGSNLAGQLGDGTVASSPKPVEVKGAIGQSYDGFVATPFVMAAGARFTCATNGSGLGQYCWGDNAMGQLGDGTQVSSALPSAQRWSSAGLFLATAGATHACAISNSTPFCWGSNESGQLGTGTLSGSLIPVGVVFPDPRVAATATITAGRAHTCGRMWLNPFPLEQSATYCWGSNASGQLGSGSSASSAQPTIVGASDFSSTITYIDAGSDHTCALATGTAYCWGDNAHGQLGNGSLTGSNVPVRVSGGLNFSMIDAGAAHTCAIATGGAAYCWGSNSNGQLGNGTTTASSVPVPVVGGLSFRSLSVGELHTCGVTTTAGVYCWGANADGQLGDGTTTDRATPVKVVDVQ